MSLHRPIAAILVAVFASSVHGQDLSWTGISGGIPNSNWQATGANPPSNWLNAGAPVPWSTLGASAVFNGAGAGAITVVNPINVSSFNVTSGNYTFNPFLGGPATFAITEDLLGTLPVGTVHVAAGSILVNNVSTRTAFGLTKTGGGTLRIGAQFFMTNFGLNTIRISSNTAVETIGSAGTVEIGSGGFIFGQPPPRLVIGAGWLNIGSVGIGVNEIVFRNSVQSGAYGPNGNNGVYGPGPLNLFGPVTVEPNPGGFSNTLAANFDISAAFQQFNIGADVSRPEYTALHVTGVIGSGGGTGGIFKGSAGIAADRIAGGIGLYGNNTYTGPTTISGGAGGTFSTEPRGNVVAGTNASQSLNVIAGHVTLFGANGSYQSATTVQVNNGGTLSLDNQSSTNGINAPAVAAANNSNRLADSAAVTLSNGTLNLIGQSGGPTSETYGSLHTATGSNVVAALSNGGDSTLSASGSWTQSGDDITIFRGTVLGGSSKIKFGGTVPAGVGPEGMIERAYGANEQAPAEIGFVKYDAANGITLLPASAYSSQIVTGRIARIAGAQVAIPSTAITALLATDATVSFQPGATLSVETGQILSTESLTLASLPENATVAFGPKRGKFIAIGNITVNTALTGNAGLIKSGRAALELNGDLSGLSGTLAHYEGTTVLSVPYNNGNIRALGGVMEVRTDLPSAAVGIELGDPATPVGAVGSQPILRAAIAANVAIAPSIAISPGGAVIETTSAEFQATFGGVFTGSGTLIKRGPGKATLTGNSPAFAGNIDIREGTVAFNGVFAAAQVVVGPGATGQGFGTLTIAEGMTVNPLGVIKGGNSIGTLTVAGNVSMIADAAGGAILRVEGNAANNSKIAVSGAFNSFNLASLSGANKITIDVIGPTLVPGTSYIWELVQTANPNGLLIDGVAGTGGTISPAHYLLTSQDFAAFTNVSLVANGNSLVLTFTPVPEPAFLLSAAALLLLKGVRNRFGVRRMMSGGAADDAMTTRL